MSWVGLGDALVITINWGILPGAGVEQSNHNELGASINPALSMAVQT